MAIQAWPFLVSRNKSLGYQTIVAPDFLVEAKVAGLLAKEAGGDLTNSPRYCELRKTRVGSITLAYRVVRATDGDELFRDEVGRPILWIEGLVLKGLRNETVISDQALQEAHQHVIDAYREFWENNTGNQSVRASQSFMILGQRAGEEATSTVESSPKAETYAAKRIEDKQYPMTNPTSHFVIIIISVMLVALTIFHVIQARRITSLEGRLNSLEQMVLTPEPALEGSNIIPASPRDLD